MQIYHITYRNLFDSIKEDGIRPDKDEYVRANAMSEYISDQAESGPTATEGGLPIRIRFISLANSIINSIAEEARYSNFRRENYSYFWVSQQESMVRLTSEMRHQRDALLLSLPVPDSVGYCADYSHFERLVNKLTVRNQGEASVVTPKTDTIPSTDTDIVNCAGKYVESLEKVESTEDIEAYIKKNGEFETELLVSDTISSDSISFVSDPLKQYVDEMDTSVSEVLEKVSEKEPSWPPVPKKGER